MRDQTVFPPEILNEIHHRTPGIPRLINSVCDNLLLTAFAMESKKPPSTCSTKYPPTCAWSGPAVPYCDHRI